LLRRLMREFPGKLGHHRPRDAADASDATDAAEA
jgi:hypothetical protein